MNNDKIFLITDGCMWESNKKNGTSHDHAIEVVDMETGQVRYIRSGSRISLVEGTITDIRTQEAYNEATAEAEKMPANRKDNLPRKRSKKGSEQTGDTHAE